jgi:2-polyprenyl-6-methoxyphenol hydroxylase-like FAD-dependent oxidoreductase
VAGALGRRGVAVDVVDDQPEWAIARSGIALQAPAVCALAALGLLDAVVEAGFGMTEFRYHDGAGELRATSELPRPAGPDRPGTVGVMRSALHAILLAAARDAGATRLVVEQSVARTEGIIRPWAGFDVATFERRIWGELAKPY